MLIKLFTIYPPIVLFIISMISFSLMDNIYVVILSLLIAIVAIFDLRARYADLQYCIKYMEGRKAEGKSMSPIARMYKFSWCQRIVYNTALRMTDCTHEIDFFYHWGYRWYHILPDNFFKNIFKLKFYRAVFLGISWGK